MDFPDLEKFKKRIGEGGDILTRFDRIESLLGDILDFNRSIFLELKKMTSILEKKESE